MIKIVNLTPHNVNFMGESDKVLHVFERCENPPRLKENKELDGLISFNKYFIRVFRKEFQPETNLPPQIDGVFYIVSNLIASAFPDRNDLLIPDDVVRDNDGQIVGCRGFAKV